MNHISPPVFGLLVALVVSVAAFAVAVPLAAMSTRREMKRLARSHHPGRRSKLPPHDRTSDYLADAEITKLEKLLNVPDPSQSPQTPPRDADRTPAHQAEPQSFHYSKPT